MKSVPINKMSKKRLRIELINSLSVSALLDQGRTWLKLMLELANSQVKGITDDRNDLQREHETVLGCFDGYLDQINELGAEVKRCRGAESKLNLEINKLTKTCEERFAEIEKLNGDLVCSADRSERYRLRCIKIEDRCKEFAVKFRSILT